MEQPNLNYIYNMSDGDKLFEKKLIDIIAGPEFSDSYIPRILIILLQKTTNLQQK